VKGLRLRKKWKPKNLSDVDKGLVAMFLKMSTEERLRANDNAARTIWELRNAYKQQRPSGPDLSTLLEGLFSFQGGIPGPLGVVR
jgi:hypothetical protein